MSLFEPSFGYVAFAASALSFHCYSQSFYISKLRKEYGLLYPDQGDGRYSQKLTDQQWEKFNCYQRAHHNYLESLTPTITWLLLGGIKYPYISTGLAAVIFVARQFYCSGYRKRGPSGRFIGGYISGAGVVGLFVTAMASSIKITKAIAHLISY